MKSSVATTITLSALAATQTRELFTYSLPSPAEVRSNEIHYTLAEIRHGEATGALLAILVGGLCAKISNDKLPLIVTLIMSAGIIGAHEFAYRKQRS